jgi:hypothetical protein
MVLSPCRDFTLEVLLQSTHPLLDVGQFLLTLRIERRGEIEAIPAKTRAVRTWCLLVALELSPPALKTTRNQSVPAADARLRGRGFGGIVWHGVVTEDT